jgi:hypothetical protein
MPELSPAAQAVNSAYMAGGLAAALEAAADQIGPDGHDYSHGSIAELM